MADDLNHVVTLAWTPGDDPAGFLDKRPDVRAIENPIDPVTGLPQLSEARLYEWLDRPWTMTRPPNPRPSTTSAGFGPPSSACRARSGSRAPTPSCSRRSSPRWVAPPLGRVATVRREATPCPSPSSTPPSGRSGCRRGSSTRRPAPGSTLGRRAVLRGRLDQAPSPGARRRTPLEAGRLAGEGDLVARVKLEAVVRLREQLGQRPTTLALYQGYPFDRLRRRLGLAPTDPDAIDPLDAASMSGPELDKLDPRPSTTTPWPTPTSRPPPSATTPGPPGSPKSWPPATQRAWPGSTSAPSSPPWSAGNSPEIRPGGDGPA